MSANVISRRSSICEDVLPHNAKNNELCESGYASGTSSESFVPEIVFTKPHLKFLNKQLAQLSPEEILRWCIMTLPSLYQTTALGPSGLVTLDILSKIYGAEKPQIDLIFLDTLHHFQETIDLVDQVKHKYPAFNMHIYKPDGLDDSDAFAQRFGERLWETDDELYDWAAKVEPAQRSYSDLQVKAVLTGRRKTQGGKRGEIDIIEVDESGMIKVNPLANWTFDQVQTYIKEHDVPYNVLLERGYKSIGDWHSTQPVGDGDDERSGRWKGRKKSECGIHNPKSRYAQFLMQQEQQRQKEFEEQQKHQELDQVSQSLEGVSIQA